MVSSDLVRAASASSRYRDWPACFRLFSMSWLTLAIPLEPPADLTRTAVHPRSHHSGIQTSPSELSRARAHTVSLPLEIDIVGAIAGAIARTTVHKTPRVSVPRSIRLNNQRRTRRPRS
jgi:hypothetical protein